MSPELRAFLAAERANRPVEADAGVSEVASRARPVVTGGQPRSMWIAYLMWWLLGGFAAHRFYLGEVQSGIMMVGLFFVSMVMLFVMPPLGVGGMVLWLLWGIVDAFLIPGMVRRYNQSMTTSALVFA